MCFAAVVIMRPSCPEPKMPMVLPGRKGCDGSNALTSLSPAVLSLTPLSVISDSLILFQDLAGDRFGSQVQPVTDFGILDAQDAGGHQGCVGSAGLTDGHRRHRHARRHLDDGKERIQS